MAKTRSQISAEINTNLPDNNTQAITPAILRQTVLDISQAAPNIPDDMGAYALASNLNAAGVGLGNVDNTSDANKPVSTAQATAIALKIPKSQVFALATFSFDGGGSVLVATATPPKPCPSATVITGFTLIGDQSGSITVDVTMATGGSGTFTSITASAIPALSSARRVNSSTLTGWTTTIPAGADLKGVASSISTLLQCTLVLYGTYS